MRLKVTKKGALALWEKGGAWSSTGEATIVAGAKGERLAPIYISRRGHLACGEHALLPVGGAVHVIEASQHRGDFEIRVSKSRGCIADLWEKRIGDPDAHAEEWKALWEELPEGGSYVRNGDVNFWFRIAPEIYLDTVTEFSNGEWSKELPEYLEEAVQAAIDKASCYHCREPFYIKEGAQ